MVDTILTLLLILLGIQICFTGLVLLFGHSFVAYNGFILFEQPSNVIVKGLKWLYIVLFGIGPLLHIRMLNYSFVRRKFILLCAIVQMSLISLVIYLLVKTILYAIFVA